MRMPPVPPRVMVVGLTGRQAAALRQQVGTATLLRFLTPDRALKFRGDDSDVVITTRFIGHKHEWHLRRVVTCRVVCVRSGGVQAIARMLQSILSVAIKAA
jgi:hypothetical protein